METVKLKDATDQINKWLEEYKKEHPNQKNDASAADIIYWLAEKEVTLSSLRSNEPEREGKDIQKIWDEACEAQMKEVYDAIPAGSGDTNAHAIKHWTKKPQCPYNSNFKQNNNG